MTQRGIIVAALLALEVAILCEAGLAIRGVRPTSWSMARAGAQTASGPHLIEDGPHQIFDAGSHPSLTVDIGYADLTILASQARQIDVSLSGSTSLGFFRETAPITARDGGETVRIAAPGWSRGDNRMVTVLVPPDTQVTVVNAGDVQASGLHAEASINSIGNGSITVENYDAPSLHVVSSNGPILLHRVVAAHLDAKSSNDRVEGTGLQVRDGNVESDDRVTLGFAAGADTLVDAKANDGKINVSGFTSPAASVTSNRKSGDDDDDSSSGTVRVGAGDGRLEVRANDGNIDLLQEG